MPSTDSYTRYDYNFPIHNGEAVDATINFSLSSIAGLDDAMAMALAEAIIGVPCPSGVSIAGGLRKVEITETYSNADLAASPPAWT